MKGLKEYVFEAMGITGMQNAALAELKKQGKSNLNDLSIETYVRLAKEGLEFVKNDIVNIGFYAFCKNDIEIKLEKEKNVLKLEAFIEKYEIKNEPVFEIEDDSDLEWWQK